MIASRYRITHRRRWTTLILALLAAGFSLVTQAQPLPNNELTRSINLSRSGDATNL